MSMFPYPSGRLHLGHIKNYFINDINNRFYKNKINKTKFFLGWDSFGTPAENASIKKKLLASIWTKKNIFYIKRKLINFNIFINWNNELFTNKKKFYKINQNIISFLIKIKSIYIDSKFINWDLSDKSILSNEQVILNKGWRSNSYIKKIKILTYYLNFLKKKKEIFFELNNLNWNYKIKLMQKNWIIYESIFNDFFFYFIFFNIYNFNLFYNLFKYLFFLKKNLFKLKNILRYYYLYNLKFLLFSYNSGFNVIRKINFKYNELYVYNIILDLFFIKIKIIKKKFFYKKVFWELCDWGISRQRYWGSPIPSLFCFFCKKKYISNYHKLPLNIFFFKNNNFLKKNLFFMRDFCSNCFNLSVKENETMDTFFDSSWYFLNYLFKKKILNYFSPINLYIGGIEHSILHLLYSRFVLKFIRDNKFINFSIFFIKLLNQGLLINRIYYFNLNNYKFLINYKFLRKKKKNKYIIYKYFNNLIQIGNLEKISKSKNNNILFNDYVKFYGKETVKIMLIMNKSLTENIMINKLYIIYSYKYIIQFINKIYNNIKYKVIYKKNFLNKNIKKFFLKFYKILKKIFKLHLNLNYNIILYQFNKVFKYILNFKYNYIIFYYYLTLLFKYLNPFFPYITFKILKYLKIKIKYIFYFKYFYKININNEIFFLLNINNKKKFLLFIFNKKNLKIKIFNYINLKKILIFNIILKKNIVNILTFIKN